MSHNKTYNSAIANSKSFSQTTQLNILFLIHYYQPEAYVPSSDVFIEKDASINEHIEQMRLSATKAVLERRDVIIVATVQQFMAR